MYFLIYKKTIEIHERRIQMMMMTMMMMMHSRTAKTEFLNKIVNCFQLLKSNPHLQKIFRYCFIEIPLKLIKNAFYFILKALFVLKIFKFLS